MRTIHEQIQRLRDVLVTCYKAIKEKGGSIPEEGERNMTNLPAAVLSIPQTHGVLTDLEVTANGVYVPEEGADGFSKVTARFDTSRLPKVKVLSFQVTNDCINEDGRWGGESLIDTSECVSFMNTFLNCTNLEKLDVSNWNVSNITTLQNMFQGCLKLKYLNLKNWDTQKVTTINSAFSNCYELISINGSIDLSNVTVSRYAFMNCYKLETLDLTNWDASKDTDMRQLFMNCGSLTSIVGNRTYDDVVANNITCMSGYIPHYEPYFYQTILDHASLRALINGLADVNNMPAESRPTLNLGTTLMAKLTEEDIAIAVNKGWSIS